MGGKLVIAGGNLHNSEKEIHKIFIDFALNAGGKLAIVPTASGQDPVSTIKHVEELWISLGVKPENIVAIPVYGQEGKEWREPPQGDDQNIINMLDGVTGFWFTGGDQYYTHKAFIRKNQTDTEALEIMKKVYEAGGVIGGTSAGAAIMSETMIASGNNITALNLQLKHGYDDYDDSEEDESVGLRLVKGLGFFKDGVIDQHYDARPRLLRTIKAVMDSYGNVNFGYGVSEDTALIYDRDTKDITVSGSGAVYIMDLTKSKMNNESSYTCKNTVLHIIKKGDTFNQFNIME